MKHLLFLLFVLLYGCASTPTGSPFTPINEAVEGKATVYIYRPSAFPGSLRNVNVFINSQPNYVLSNGTYVAAHLTPGKYKFGAKNTPKWGALEGTYIEVEYELLPNKTYYVGYFKSFEASRSKEESYFHTSSSQQLNTGILEGGLLDIEHLIGIVKKENALPDLQKLKHTALEVDEEKI